MNKEYLNKELSVEARTEILLSQMSIEEKIGQMLQISASKSEVIEKNGESELIHGKLSDEEVSQWVSKKYAGSFLHVLGVQAKKIQQEALSTRLGIPVLFGIDAIHGHGLHNGATIFPSQLSTSCSWNKELIEEMGKVTAKEVAADGLHWTFSPVLCLGRDTRWGRIAETFGEDQFLVGELAAAIIKGYQGKSLLEDDSILACAKHYIAYGESTGGRDSYDTEISYRKLREVFLPPFKKAVEAGCATFMTGYQSIAGVPATANKKVLKKILKDEIGFKGFVVTDWNNVGSLIINQSIAKDIKEAAYQAIISGNDMIMNTPEFYEAALQLVKEGRVSESIINEAVKRILNIKFAMGLFEKVNTNKTFNDNIFSCKEHLEVNLNLTRESMVLLENKNHILPLKKTIKKIAVIGPNANDIKAQYGDWTYFSHPIPNPEAIPEPPFYTMLSGIKAEADKNNIEVLYNKGCHIMNSNEHSIASAVETALKADVVVAVIGDCLEQNGEFKDRANLDLFGAQQELLEALKATGKPLIVILVNGKPLTIPWISKNSDALIETFNSGMFGGKAVGEILFGEVNPSGKLSISFPYHSGQLPVYYNQLPGWHGGKYVDLPSTPLYSFGYGLSYSNFKYSNLKISKTICSKDDVIEVSVEVTNISNFDGFETVQLYVNDVISSHVTVIKQLKGFKKIMIKANETETVSIKLPISELYLVDTDEKYIVESGEFKIMIGADSRDNSLLKGSIVLQ